MTTEERLDYLERELARSRRNNRLAIGALVGLALLTSITQAGAAPTDDPTKVQVQQQVRARAFVLHDEKGVARAMLSNTEHGPVLDLRDEKGDVRVLLTGSNDKPGLALFDENGKIRVNLYVDADGPALELRDEKGKDRAGLSVAKDGPHLSLLDATENVRIHLLATEELGPTISLSDNNTKLRLLLSARGDESRLDLLDANGTTRAVLTQSKVSQSLELSDASGNPSWKTP